LLLLLRLLLVLVGLFFRHDPFRRRNAAQRIAERGIDIEIKRTFGSSCAACASNCADCENA
jgi:hypothetical protein